MRLIRSRHHRKMRKRLVIHTHTARTTRFKQRLRKTHAHVVRPRKISGGTLFQTFPKAIRHYVRTDADILVLVHFYIVRTVILHHSTNSFGHIFDDLCIAEVQKISSHYADFFAVSTDKALVVVVGQHFGAIFADNFRLDPKSRTHTK